MRKQSCDADQLALSGVGDKGENEWAVKKFVCSFGDHRSANKTSEL